MMVLMNYIFSLCNHIQRGRAFGCKSEHFIIILAKFQLTHGYEVNGSSDSTRKMNESKTISFKYRRCS
jgi:hypothetical protein